MDSFLISADSASYNTTIKNNKLQWDYATSWKAIYILANSTGNNANTKIYNNTCIDYSTGADTNTSQFVVFGESSNATSTGHEIKNNIVHTQNPYFQFIADWGVSSSLLSSNLIFHKDYVNNQASLDADTSVGSATATFTVTRGATHPATYVDSSGVVHTVTSNNTPRYQGGYYDATGFHALAGLMIEIGSNIANLVPKSEVFNDATWDVSNMTATDNDVASPDGTTNAGTLTATNTNGSLLLHTAVTAQTFSVWLKRKTGTGTINITANGGTTWTAVTLTSSWCRFQVTAASASQKCGIQIATNTDAVYVWGAQFEAWAYATSFIPTISGSLTRNGELLKYVISGNRSADTESIFLKMATEWNLAQLTDYPAIMQTDTVDRRFQANLNDGGIDCFPNRTESADNAVTVAPSAANTSEVLAAIFYGATAATNSKGYLNGVSKATNTGNYTAPAWGTYFYIGTTNGDHTINGVVQEIAIYSDAKNAADVATISNYLQGVVGLAASFVSDYNDFYQDGVGTFNINGVSYANLAAWQAIGQDAHSISGDPLLKADYSLNTNSPCVDKGVTVATVTTDYIGTARPQGSAYDIGSFELVPSSHALTTNSKWL